MAYRLERTDRSAGCERPPSSPLNIRFRIAFIDSDLTLPALLTTIREAPGGTAIAASRRRGTKTGSTLTRAEAVNGANGGTEYCTWCRNIINWRCRIEELAEEQVWTFWL